jgi:copper chaperone NosL
MMTLARIAVLAALLFLPACSREEAALPAPIEPDANSIAYFCHMSITEHEGPKGQAFMKSRSEPYWFASVSEAFVFLETETNQSADLLVLYVNDMSKGTWDHPAAGAWIDVHKAVFVIGSSKTAAMGGQEAVPFSTSESAQAFVAQFGGNIVDFDAAARALSIEAPTSAN